MDWAKTTARQNEKHLSFEFDATYIRDFIMYNIMLYQDHIVAES